MALKPCELISIRLAALVAGMFTGPWLALPDPSALSARKSFSPFTYRSFPNMAGGGGFFRFQDQLRDVLAAAWKARGKRQTRILAACGHAADFQAWRSLARKQGLSDREVIEAMVAMVRAAPGQRPARDSDHIDK
jgi:hypothetical protein